MLEQQAADLVNELNHLIQDGGVSAIMECANNVIYNTPEFIQACTDSALSSFQHTLDSIKDRLAVVSSASSALTGQISSVLAGQAAVTASEAADLVATTMAMLKQKYGITG